MRTVPQRYVEACPIDELSPHPQNVNKGNDEAVGDLIDQSGFYGAVIVQESTRLIIAGHTRWRSAKAAGATTIPALFVDVNDDEALRMMLGDNRASELAERDDGGLVALLQHLAGTEQGLAGTGYESDDVDEYVRLLSLDEMGKWTRSDLDAEWEGMPGFTAPKADAPAFSVTVHFKDDEDADEFFKLIDRERRRSLEWPEPFSERRSFTSRTSGFVAVEDTDSGEQGAA